MNIAVITGASSGLGVKFLEAVMKRYPSLDEYWIIARRKDRLEELVGKYPNKHIVPVDADLGDEANYGKIREKLETEKPTVKVVINNAGFERTGKYVDMKDSDILNMISVNVKGTSMVSKIFLPYMTKGSFMVITCSVSSFVPVPKQTVYSASKKYVYYFGKALREEVKADGINVLLLCPGNMDTEMNPKGQGSQSKTVDSLPFLDMEKLTAKALIKAEQGKAVYTPGGFYKFYRVAAKAIPSAWMLKIVGKSY